MCRGNVYDKHVMSGPTYLPFYPGLWCYGISVGGRRSGEGDLLIPSLRNLRLQHTLIVYVFMCLCIRELACGADFVDSHNYFLRDTKEGNKNASRMISARVNAVIIVNVGQYEGDPH